MGFADVVGHRAQLTLIASAVARESIPPSLIFEGPEGVGKRLVACALAQALNCRTPRDQKPAAGSPVGREGLAVDACGRCQICQRIARGSFADVLTIGPGDGGSITIDQVRAAIDQAAYRPFEGRRRVVILDDADRLVREAQNALLKTLEEPPASSQFVLVTARPDALLPTVRSRCQRLRFGELDVAALAARLTRVHGYTAAEARAAAASAGGSLGRALRVASGELTATRDAALAFLSAVMRAADPKVRLESAKALVGGRGSGKAAAAVRQELIRRLGALGSLIRDLTLLGAGAEASALANADLRDGLAPMARMFVDRRGPNAYVAVDEAIEAAEGNVNPKIVADWLACTLWEH